MNGKKKVSVRVKDLTWQELQDTLADGGVIMPEETIKSIVLMHPKVIRLFLER